MWLLMAAVHIDNFERFDDSFRQPLLDGDEVMLKLEAME